MEHYVELKAEDVAPLVLKPVNKDEKVRVHTDGFVTMGESGSLFAAIDSWDASEGGEHEIEQLAYILKETARDDVSEDGVDRFIEVEFGRIKPFLRMPDGPDSLVYVYPSGMVSLAPDDVPFAQMDDWAEEDIWKLEQLANKFGTVIMTRTETKEEVPFDDADDTPPPPSFW